MINIVLVCAGGVSTSMMVVRMKNAAKTHGYDVSIIATGADEFEDEQMEADILLVAPQIAYEFARLKEDHQNDVKVIKMIDRDDYGKMNGEKVLIEAIDDFRKG